LSEDQVKPNGGWTFHTLFMFFDLRIQDLEKRYDSELELRDRSVKTALGSNERQLDNMNKFREALEDQAKNMMPRNEYNVMHESLERRVAANEEAINQSTGRGLGSTATVGWVFAIVMGAVAIIELWTH
jgi:hypothetical protein